MTARKKPDLSAVPAFIVESEFLPDALRAELMLHLTDAPLTGEQKAALLRFCNDWAQLPADTTPAAQQSAQLEAIASNARRLLASMKLDDGTRDVLAAHARCDLGHDRDFLSNVWDAVAALERAAEYTREQMTIDRQSKPGQQRAHALVFSLAGHVCSLTGQMPPKDRASWFAAFAACVGEHFGLTVGPRIIKSGIEAATPAR
ncbi:MULTISPECIES: hypothetical protein [Burkholderia]|uniref:hypothetical protein n=1 Tax=Burkholderia TaxID=32008 RepID=UPI000842266D|nr:MULTISPECIES: hypothetical protein [unclassified Burkholderia]AOK29871.1 hypothetical protein AQ611_10985 [Burkholderia sp. Bp7605]